MMRFTYRKNNIQSDRKSFVSEQGRLIRLSLVVSLAFFCISCGSGIPDCDDEEVLRKLVSSVYEEDFDLKEVSNLANTKELKDLVGLSMFFGKNNLKSDLMALYGLSQLPQEYLKHTHERIKPENFKVTEVSLVSKDKDSGKTFCSASIRLTPNKVDGQKFLDFLSDARAKNKSANGRKVGTFCELADFAVKIQYGKSFKAINELSSVTTVEYSLRKNLSEGGYLLDHELDNPHRLGLPVTVAMLSRCYDERFGTYEGGVLSGLWHGKGKVVFPDGVKYEGNFKEGKAHGKGTLRYASGTKYEGSFNNGIREGAGTLFLSTGEKYVGEWHKNKYHGRGTLYGKDGKVLKDGMWSQGKFVNASNKSDSRKTAELPANSTLAQERDGQLSKGVQQANPAETALISKEEKEILQDYAASIRSKIRSRISFDPIRAPDNPEVVYSVEQNSNGRIIRVSKKKSSGNADWDAAIERAIWGSSPLPRRADGRIENPLTLAFRPVDSTSKISKELQKELRTAKVRVCIPPTYPRQSQINNEQGITQLRLLIGVDGKVKESVIAESSGYDRLDRAAVSALSRCEFEPEVKDGIPIESWGKIRYVWKLE